MVESLYLIKFPAENSEVSWVKYKSYLFKSTREQSMFGRLGAPIYWREGRSFEICSTLSFVQDIFLFNPLVFLGLEM
jgi:hypothetical protein